MESSPGSFKAGEFAGCAAHDGLGVANVSGHGIRHRGQETLDLGPLPFRHELHAAVRQVADKAGHAKAASDVAGAEAKADSLDAPGVMDFAANYLGVTHCPIVSLPSGYQSKAPARGS